MRVEALVQEDQIDQAVVENERLLRSYELQKESPNALALVLIALQQKGLVNEPYVALVISLKVLRACCSSITLTAVSCSEWRVK